MKVVWCSGAMVCREAKEEKTLCMLTQQCKTWGGVCVMYDKGMCWCSACVGGWVGGCMGSEHITHTPSNTRTSTSL